MGNTGLYCSNCGQLNEADAAFCSRCGARQTPLSAGTPTGSATPPPSGAAQSAPPVAQGTYGNASASSGAGGYSSAGYGGASGYATTPAPGAYGAAVYTGYAGFWLRFVAFIIDAIIVSAVTMPVSWMLGFGAGMAGMAGHMVSPPMIFAGSGVGFLFGTIVRWLYGAGFESSKYQATLGKMLLGMKVTDLGGYRITFGRATGRHFAKYLSALILCIGFFMIAFTERKQGLHDILAGTLVVRT
jgi:uncharacterized RDD family membrane protein YckC